MKFPTVLLAVALLGQSCTSFSKLVSGDAYEYQYRIKHVPKDSLVLAANGKMIPKDFSFLQGCPAPTFESIDLNGHPIKCDFKNQVTLLNFWFINCPPCVMEIPRLNQLQAKYRGKVKVVGLTTETTSAVLQFREKHPMNYWVVPDARSLVKGKFLFEWGFPKTFVIGPDGKIALVTRALLSPEDPEYQRVERLIEELTKS